MRILCLGFEKFPFKMRRQTTASQRPLASMLFTEVEAAASLEVNIQIFTGINLTPGDLPTYSIPE